MARTIQIIEPPEPEQNEKLSEQEKRCLDAGGVILNKPTAPFGFAQEPAGEMDSD